MKMKTLGWPSTYLSRCPVTLFEAARGSTTWQCGGTMGELRMRPLGGAALHFQLNDLLDGQVLYEHAMRKPDAITIPEGRFFVIRQENGSFRGFGFKDRAAANEMRERIEKAIKPFKIQSTSKSNTITINGAEQNSHLVGQEAKGNSSKKREVLSCESVPKRSSAKNKTLEALDLPIHNHSSMENTSFNSTSQKSSISKKWQKIKNGFSAISHLFVVKEHEMEIGYPTDVKHVAHIGWDGPSVTGPSWMDELKPAPDFSLGPLSDFGQPQDPGWIHDAASAARWTSQGLLEADLPPEPPREFVDDLDLKNGNSKSSPFKTKSKTFFKKQKKQR